MLLHGCIHSLGFIKAYKVAEIKALTAPISKLSGFHWLITAFLFIIYAICYLTGAKYNWLIGIIVIANSQFLIIYFWKDARFGTLPNLIILIAVLFSFGSFTFNNRIQKETSKILSQTKQIEPETFSAKDLSRLPVPIRNWLSTSGIIGREKIFMGRIEQKALLKLTPDQQDWYSAKALQYTTIDSPAFIWTVDVKMNPIMSFNGRDKFVDGKGQMSIKLNSLINIVNEQGPKLDEGTMQRFLGEMVWFPSMAVSSYITWETIDDRSARATMTYKGISGSGIFSFNKKGDFMKFSAMRFKENEADAKRYEWVLTVDEYSVFEGIKVPSRMKATWKLEEGDWTWLQLEIVDIKYN